MDRVGIVTIVDQRNYGNRLQNYALQNALKSLGVSRVETVNNSPRPESRLLLAKRGAMAIGKSPLGTTQRNLRRWLEHREARNAERIASAEPTQFCAEFSENHIQSYPTRYDEITDKRQFASDFDAFVVGSDQVWNPGFRNVNGIDFLTFAKPLQRIAYSASFGIPQVPGYLRSVYRRRLRGIPSISVRESSGASIVNELIGRSVPVVLDPTLAVPSEQWTSLASTPAELHGRDYALSFFLGGFKDGERERLQQDYRRAGLDLVDYQSTAFLACAPPELFLGALRGAKVVVTDSFHAAALSLVMRTPFRVRFRNAGDTRMDALFSLLGARTDGPHELAIPVPAWDAVQERLEVERHRSLAWLGQALERASAS